MKKTALILLAVCMTISILSACGSSTSSSSPASLTPASTTSASTQSVASSDPAASGEKVTLTFDNFWQEYPEQIKVLQEIYTRDNPNVTIENNTVGGDYDKVLQTKIATGEIPDLFMSGSYAKNRIYTMVSEDLTDEDLWSNIDESFYDACLSEDGRRISVPIIAQAWGFIYNKDVFSTAGITKLPETLTELNDATAKLRAIDVSPFAQGFKESYVQNQLNTFIWAVDANIDTVVRDMIDKKSTISDHEVFDKVFSTLDVVKANTQNKPFDTDVIAQATLLAQGKAGMSSGGDWIYSSILKAKPDANVGIMGIPMSEDPADCKIFVSAGHLIHVGKNSANREHAINFLKWMTTSESANKWLAEEMKVLSPIKGVLPKDNTILNDAVEYINQKKTGSWGSTVLPAKINELIRPVLSKYLADQITKEDAIKEIDKVFADYTP